MSDEPAPRSGRAATLATWAALALCVALAAALRVRLADGRELWYDDVGRLQVAFVPWDRLWSDVPWLCNLKSPYLVVLDKLWLAAAGDASLLALRGASILWGTLLVAAAAAVAWRLVGPRAALVAAVLYGAGPFFLRWSIEVHSYASAGVLALAAWWVATGAARWTPARAAATGALAGIATALFPPAALAAVPVALVPGARRAGLRGVLVAAAVATAIALPALLAIAESQRVFAAAFEAGRGWAPYFNPRRTPFEVMGRLAGLDVRQGRFTWHLAAGAVALAGACAWCLLRWRPRGDADGTGDAGGTAALRDAWETRAALALSALVPLVVLAVVSVAWLGVFNDRYLTGAGATIPLALVVCLAPPPDGSPSALLAFLRPWSARLGTALLAAPLAVGLRTAISQGDAFPKDLTARSYRGAALLDAADAPRAAVPVPLFVHGEALFCHVLLRSARVRTGALLGSHLTTSAWVDVARRRDTAQVDVPMSYGWPFSADLVARRPTAVAPPDVHDAFSRGGEIWLLFEHPPLRRGSHLEEEERESGVGAIWDLAAEPPSPERDAAVAVAARRIAGADASASTDVRSDGNALLVVVRR